MPLLDLDDFLHTVERNDGSNTVSLLLFQAAMFAGTAFIDIRFLLSHGYGSRKSARKAFFQRARVCSDTLWKALHDRLVANFTRHSTILTVNPIAFRSFKHFFS